MGLLAVSSSPGGEGGGGRLGHRRGGLGRRHASVGAWDSVPRAQVISANPKALALHSWTGVLGHTIV